MTETVKMFQKQFNLTADGVVGRSTWYKISYIYVSVKDLAELTSEGETFSGTLPDSSWNFGSSVLKQGSTGSEVEQMQFWLSTLAQYESSIPSVTVDGVYGSGTAAAVRAFQRLYGLTVDGIVGRKTWDSLYGKASALRSSGPGGTLKRLPYPGTPLTVGTDSSAVLYYTLLLQRIAYYYDSVASPALSSHYTQETADATASALELLCLPATGVADA